MKDYYKGHFDPKLYSKLTSVLSFCSDMLGTPLPLPSERGTAKSRVLVAEWDMSQVIEDLKKAGSQGSVHDTVSTFILVCGLGANYECSTCSEALVKRFGDPGRMAIVLIADIIEKVLAGDNEEFVPISWLINGKPPRPSSGLSPVGRVKLKNRIGQDIIRQGEVGVQTEKHPFVQQRGRP